MAQSIAFINQKGGVGKTTLCYHLAHTLAQMGKKVLLLDLDPQANLTQLLNPDWKQNKFSIYHLLVNSVRDLKPLHTSIMLSQLMEQNGRLQFLPASDDLSAFEMVMNSSQSCKQLVLQNFLHKSGLMDQFDFILLDAPPTLGLMVINILLACSKLVIPVAPDRFSRFGLLNLQETIEAVGEMGLGSPPEIAAVVPNLVDTRRNLSKDELSLIGDHLPLAPILPNRLALAKCCAQGKSVFEYQGEEFIKLQHYFTDLAHMISGNHSHQPKGRVAEVSP